MLKTLSEITGGLSFGQYQRPSNLRASKRRSSNLRDLIAIHELIRVKEVAAFQVTATADSSLVHARMLFVSALIRDPRPDMTLRIYCDSISSFGKGVIISSRETTCIVSCACSGFDLLSYKPTYITLLDHQLVCQDSHGVILLATHISL